MVKTKNVELEQNKNSLKKVNNYLFNSLERLDDLDLVDVEYANIEIKRCNSIAQTSKTIVSAMALQLAAIRSKEYLDDSLYQSITGNEKSE